MSFLNQVTALFHDGSAQVARETVRAMRKADRLSAPQQDGLCRLHAALNSPRQTLFDRVMDGLNRLPRPLLAFGTLAFFASAMIAPEWFSARMSGLAAVPEPLWWLAGIIVSFYFGARHQVKSQAFQRELLAAAAQLPAPDDASFPKDAAPADR